MFVFLIILWIDLANPRASYPETPGQNKKILVLNSYNYGYMWSDLEMKGIESELRNSDIRTDIHMEFLDAKRAYDSEHLQNIFRLFKYKFSDDKFDIIIAADNDAFNFVKKRRIKLFPDVPLVFCGINDFSPAMIIGQKNITGVAEVPDYAKTIEIALKLFPDAHNIIVVTDDTVTGTAHTKRIMELEPHFKSRADFSTINLANMTMRDLQVRLSLLDDKSIVLLIAHFKDSTGRSYSIQESLGMLARTSNAPSFVVTEDRVGSGVVGGMVVSGDMQGRTAARLALRILKGEKADNIAVVTESPNKYIFDYNVLKRWKIDESRLPEGSIIKNRPVSFYESNKKIIWVSLSIFIIFIALIAGLSSNLLKRIKLEKLLRANQDRLNIILETMPVGILIMDKNGNMTYANATAEKILGMASKNIFMRNYNDPGWDIYSVNGTAVDNGNLPFAIVKKTGRPFLGAEHSIMRPDGKKIFLTVNTAPMFDSAGEFSGVITSISDISDRIEAQKALIESENRFNLFMNHLPGFAYIKDINGRHIYTNERFSTELNIKTEDRIDITNKDFMNNDTAQKLSLHDSDIMQKGRPIIFEESLHIKDETRVFLSYKFPIPAKDGAILLGGISIDITEQKRLEDQLLHAQKMEAIGTLAGGVAHDFNNILTAILGYAHLAMMKLNNDDKLKQHMERIIESGQRAALLTQRLLAFSRKQTLNLQIVDVREIINHFEQLILRLLPENVELKLILFREPLQILADTTQIEQVLMNLSTNARDAMPEGGILEISTSLVLIDREKTIETGIDSPGKYAQISIRDSGCGIDNELMDKIFEPFFTTKEPGKGTGLGLSMVYGTIKKHQGYINATSKANTGTRFDIFLPLADQGEKIEPPSELIS
jgi:PAS domain S-box-containing protein